MAVLGMNKRVRQQKKEAILQYLNGLLKMAAGVKKTNFQRRRRQHQAESINQNSQFLHGQQRRSATIDEEKQEQTETFFIFCDKFGMYSAMNRAVSKMKNFFLLLLFFLLVIRSTLLFRFS
jgi:hypothetical protein